MKVVKDFNDFTYSHLSEGNEEKLNIGKYQRSLQKFYKDSGYFLYYASTFNTATLVLIPVIEKFFHQYSMQESLMLTVFSIAILTKESKSKVKRLHLYLLENGVTDEDIEKTIIILTNIFEIFKAILSVSKKNIINFTDMLSTTNILVPYLSVISSLIDNGFIGVELLSKPLQEVKDELGDEGFKMLIHRILHKLNIITKSTGKFQNKDNVKPLKVNDELKGPMVYKEDVVLEGKLSEETDDIKGQVERSKKLSKEMKEKILPLINISGIHGTRYKKGVVYELSKPKVSGKSFNGVGIGADKDGFFVMTHRARSKSYPELSDIPNKDIKFVESTG